MTLTVIEYAARRCQICASRHAFFGFGPPLTDPAVYACITHRAEVEANLMATPPDKYIPPVAHPVKQGILL